MLMRKPALIKKNDIITGDSLNKAITHLKEHSFGFQDRLQVDGVIIEKFNFSMRGFRKINVNSNTIPVLYKNSTYLEYEFVAAQRKLKFKRSGLKNVELSMYDISTNPSVFDKNFMVFIDGKLVDCVKIIPREGGVDLVINIVTGMNPVGIDESVFKKWVSDNVEATVVFFSNSDFNPLITGREILSTKSSKLSLQNSGIIEDLETDQTYITFVTSNNLGYNSKLIDTTNSTKLLSFFKDIDASTSKSRAYLNIFGFKNLSKMMSIPVGTKVFQIPGYEMPVPAENILIFKETVDGKMFTSNISLVQHYPNFYSVENNINNDKLHLLIFYSDQNGKQEGFINEVESYYEVMGDNVTTFNNAPAIIKNFQPSDTIFSIPDYLNSGIVSDYEYKLNKISNLADSNPEFLRQFLKDHIERYDGLYIDVSKIDYTSRLKLNNHGEISVKEDRTVFNEEMFLIVTKNIGFSGKYAVNFFIDGEYYVPDKVYTKGKYEYYYIPSYKIKPDSFIEIERFEVFSFSKEGYFSDLSSTRSITTTVTNYTRTDINVYDKVTGTYLTQEDFNVYTVESDESVKFIPVGCVDYIGRNKIYVTVLNPNFINKTLVITVSRVSETQKAKATVKDIHMSHSMELGTNVSLDKLRVFNSKGRLVQLPHYDLTHSGSHYDDTIVDVKLETYVSEFYHFNYTPYSYETLLDLYELPDNNILYLKGIIDKPFDLSYYDMYVNGKRLSKKNIKILSPYLIQIINVQSAHNLLLMERTNWYEILPATESKSVIDEVWETNQDFKDAVLSMGNGSTNTEPDVVEDMMYWYLKELQEMFEIEMLKAFLHVNPDVQQITDEMIAKYPRLFRKWSIIHINGDVTWNETTEQMTIYHLNPDMNRASNYTDELEDLYNRFMLAAGVHLNPDVEQITDLMILQYPEFFNESDMVHVNPDIQHEDDVDSQWKINPDN